MKPIKPVLATFAALIVAPSLTSATAQTYPVECAQRDVQLVTQMEQYGEAQSVPGDVLYEAFRTLTRSRQICSEGRVAVGLALYDSIFKASLAGQVQPR